MRFQLDDDHSDCCMYAVRERSALGAKCIQNSMRVIF